MTTWTNSAVESSARSKPRSSASCWRPTGPAAHGCVLQTVRLAVVERHDRFDRRSPCGQVGAVQQTVLRGRRSDRSPPRRSPRRTGHVPSRSPPRASRRGSRRRCAGRSQRARGCGRARPPAVRAGRDRSSRAMSSSSSSVELDRSRGSARAADSRAPRTRSRARGRPPGARCRSSRRRRSQPPKAPGTHAARTPVPGIELVPELVEALDRRGRRCDTLAAERERLAAIDGPEDRGDLAARPVQVRLDDLQDEAGRDRPRRRRSRPARAPTSRSATRASASTRPSRRCRGARGGGERQGRTTKYALNGSCSRRCTSTEVKPASASSSRAFCSPHIAPRPSPPCASETVMQCMHEIM